MPEIRSTAAFDRWLKRLRDRQGKAAILARINRVRAGLVGDVRPVGSGLSEIRIDVGPGYRVYFVRKEASFVLLLGGDKDAQQRDIVKAQKLASELE